MSDPAAVGELLARQGRVLDQALMAQDAGAAAECFTDDAVLGESGLEDLRGRSPIRAFLTEANQRRRVVFHRLRRDDLLVAGDHAVETCRFEETKQSPGGQPVHERGRAVIFWRKEPDRMWRIRHLVVSDLPPPAESRPTAS
jgi:ketosteroid isomerase-like protein